MRTFISRLLSIEEDASLEEILIRMIQLIRNEDTSFVEEMLESVRAGDPLFVENLFKEGLVSSKLKYILMAGISHSRASRRGCWKVD